MQAAAPAITVLMPAYNAAAYIRESVESVLTQTFHDFELLIIDDGSGDATLELVNSFSDERIRLISRPNKGLIDTLNEGLALAKSDFVARHDADDFCMPQRLEKQYAFLQTHPDHVLVGADVAYVDKDGIPLTTIRPGGYCDADVREIIFKKNPFLHSAVLYRKAAIIKAGGYPHGALTFEDWLLWISVLKLGKMCNLPEVLEKVTLNPESVTIDERWRGPEFINLRLGALQRGHLLPQEIVRLKAIIGGQSSAAYKKASYHAIVAKKYLWDNPAPARARQHLGEAIKAWPGKKEPYLLWAMSWLPSAWIRAIYNRGKRAKA